MAMAGVKQLVDHCQIDRNSFVATRARRDIIGGIKTKLRSSDSKRRG